MQMLDAVRGHHERFDGTGYPDGKAKSDLTVFAQIISVADTYDAMTSARSYRAALSHEEAVARLKEAAGSQLNPAIVAIFLKAFSRKA
jgi:HD-GYP domain-containing protein (c-di-GMP phosphodiesterase class II)